MKKILILAVAAILLSRVVSVSASNSNAKNKNPELPIVAGEIVITPTVAVTPENCLDNVINHGDYVFCIARQHLGGAVTSQAAKSDIGKTDNEEILPTVAPTVVPTVAPTATPTVAPTEAPTEVSTEEVLTPTVAPTEAIAPTEVITPAVVPTIAPEATSEEETFGTEIKKLLNQIRGIIGSFVFLPNYR